MYFYCYMIDAYKNTCIIVSFSSQRQHFDNKFLKIHSRARAARTESYCDTSIYMISVMKPVYNVHAQLENLRIFFFVRKDTSYICTILVLNARHIFYVNLTPIYYI